MTSPNRTAAARSAAVQKDAPEAVLKVDRRNRAWNGFLEGDVASLIYAVAQCLLSITLCITVWQWTPERYFISTNNAFQLLQPTPVNEPFDDSVAIQYAGESVKEFLRVSRVSVLDDLNRAFRKKVHGQRDGKNSARTG